jgi:hypothetical protein
MVFGIPRIWESWRLINQRHFRKKFWICFGVRNLFVDSTLICNDAAIAKKVTFDSNQLGCKA